MCQGGIYDHLGGGFSRYATDAEWLIPHFEKMLYDNAALLDLLALVWQESREPLYEQRIREIVAWLLREMLTPAEAIAGRRAFASALDADSEGVEGKSTSGPKRRSTRCSAPMHSCSSSITTSAPRAIGKSIRSSIAAPGRC
jgi:uncharacterized protein YyaL (SSP411 family)